MQMAPCRWQILTTVHESQVFSSSGAMAVGLLAYLAEEWYNFQGLCAIMMFLMSIVAFFVPESPRSVCSVYGGINV